MTPMPTFWISAIGLLALALVLVLPSLLRSRTPEPAGSGAQRANLSILRDQLAQLDAERAAGSITGEQQAQAKADIERRALDEEDGAQAPANNARAARTTRPVRTAVLVGLGIPLLALGMYGFLGNPQALQPNLAGAAPEGEITAAQIEAMVAQMAQRLENQPADQPADPKAWEMLARSYAAMQRFPEADKAYKRATALAPTNAQLLADHADVLAMLQNQSAQGEPTRLIERALQLDPKNLKALALAGSAAFERKDFTQAVDYWTRARQLAPAGSDFASGLDRSLEDARAASGTPVKKASAASTAASASPAAAGAASAGASSAASIQGSVSVSPALKAQIAPDDTVFIFARAAQGPRMPLAILRRKASELPIAFTLDDSSAMSADLKLSKFPLVVVGARVSKSGNAMPQSGDLLGQSGPVKAGGDKLTLMIDAVQP